MLGLASIISLKYVLSSYSLHPFPHIIISALRVQNLSLLLPSPTPPHTHSKHIHRQAPNQELYLTGSSMKQLTPFAMASTSMVALP